MHEITCPHCGKAFKIDEAGYADIPKQVRDREFESELHERLERAVELAKSKVSAELEKESAKRDAEIERLKAELKSRDEQIAYYKDLKAKMSTKMVGETLEQHCEIEFNRLRATGSKGQVDRSTLEHHYLARDR